MRQSLRNPQKFLLGKNLSVGIADDLGQLLLCRTVQMQESMAKYPFYMLPSHEEQDGTKSTCHILSAEEWRSGPNGVCFTPIIQSGHHSRGPEALKRYVKVCFRRNIAQGMSRLRSKRPRYVCTAPGQYQINRRNRKVSYCVRHVKKRSKKRPFLVPGSAVLAKCSGPHAKTIGRIRLAKARNSHNNNGRNDQLIEQGFTLASIWADVCRPILTSCYNKVSTMFLERKILTKAKISYVN